MFRLRERFTGPANAVRVLVVVLVVTSFLAFPVMGMPVCRGVDTALTEARRQEYAVLVAGALNGRVRSSQVTISAFMQAGVWSAVRVATPVADDGVLFFVERQGEKQFRDVWGGWAQPSERRQLSRWARRLGAPDLLARCFAGLMK
ncbi:hypothetical protein GOB93_14600 [Acetobacter musti]|uniref:TPM domain-containing protein n=1 Tax=Acetobacter musti TaxID=864732 RepID=A0ABX0JRA9_9PROT|nr:hypothetical protein [Acetobacter musti]NHN85862.1 hypothetical protein [Acetobacter musti]